MNRLFLEQALALAAQGRTLAPPNPSVGCVIVGADGDVVGQGHTQRTGGPHGEVMALRDAAARGASVVGATAYVTLEPCSHQGRTGPCCDALVQAGIARVVATLQDPNPLVAGRGFARLRAAGVEVMVLPSDDPLALASRALNIGFFTRMERKTPWVRLKVAASLDGRTALPNGVSQWITSPQARADGHAWRARACVVLTGSGTLLQDRPRLDVRLVETQRQPHVAVVDSALRTPPDAPIFMPGRKVWIYAATRDLQKQQALEAAGASVVYVPQHQADGTPTGKVDLHAMLRDLGQHDINEVHVEAGHKLNGALLQAGLVDECLLYLAPMLLGQGMGMAQLGPYASLDSAVRFELDSVERVGPDVRLVARVLRAGAVFEVRGDQGFCSR